MDNQKRWTTADQLEYLDKIGTHAGPSDTPNWKKAELLRGALTAYGKRSNWVGLDREKIIAHTQKLLIRYEGGAIY